MNLKKKMRRGSLAALITLALTSSALAMPTGGVVQSGDVNIGGSTDFSTVANGATIGATTDSTINWNTFNIANGETLNFNIARWQAAPQSSDGHAGIRHSRHDEPDGRRCDCAR